MNWIETKDKKPDVDVDVLCCLRDAAKTVDDMFFIGSIDENGKWYIYTIDGEVEAEDNRYYISHWCEILSPI